VKSLNGHATVKRTKIDKPLGNWEGLFAEEVESGYLP